MKRTFLALVAFACSAAAYGAYTTGFENPPFTGSAGGDLIAGVDGWYLPPAAGSLDWRVYTYAGNTLGFSTLPVVGQLQFAGGMADGSGAGFARMQRDENFDASDTWTASWYIAWKFAGTLPANNNVGSFSQQPSLSTRFWQTLYSWVDPNVADQVNAGFLAFDATGAQFAQPGQYPGLEWQNLEVDHWYKEETTWSYTTNTILRVSITDINTGVTAVALPPYPVPAGGTDQWYLAGGSGGGGLDRPTGYRFFAGGTLNAEAVDNFVITPGMVASPEGDVLISPGIVLSGDVRQLFESDNQRLVVRPSAQPSVDIQVHFTVATANPSVLNLVVESSANEGNIGQTLALRNVVTGMDEVLDSHTLTLADATTTAAVTSNASRFVDQTTHRVTAVIRCRPMGPILCYPWRARFDRVVVTGTP